MTTLSLTDLVVLFGNLVMLSLLTNGSALAALPDVRRMMVTDMGLLSDGQFTSSIALAQAAPGPTLLMFAVIGYQAGGLPGAVAMLLGMLLPSTTMSYAAARWGQSRRESRVLRAFKSATAPIVVALPFATGWTLAAQAPEWGYLTLTAAAALLVWLTRTHVLLLIAAGAVAGATGLL